MENILKSVNNYFKLLKKKEKKKSNICSIEMKGLVTYGSQSIWKGSGRREVKYKWKNGFYGFRRKKNNESLTNILKRIREAAEKKGRGRVDH